MRKNKPFRRLFTAYFVVITGITVVVFIFFGLHIIDRFFSYYVDKVHEETQHMLVMQVAMHYKMYGSWNGYDGSETGAAAKLSGDYFTITDLAGNTVYTSEKGVERCCANPNHKYTRVRLPITVDGKTVGELLPVGLRELACALAADQAAPVLAQLAAIMAEPAMRDRVVQAIKGGVDHFLDNLGPMAAMAKGFLNLQSLDSLIHNWLSNQEGSLETWLQQPEIEARAAQALREQVAAFFAQPLAVLLARIGPERLDMLCQQTATQLLAALTEETLQQRLSVAIRAHIEELLEHGQLSLAALADKLPTESRRRLRHSFLTELQAIAASEPVRRQVSKLTNSLLDQLAARPGLILRDLLPATVRSSIAEQLVVAINRLLIREVPGLTESLRIRELVRNKVDSLDLLRLERLLLSIMEEQFKYINLFGALLGFLIGLLNVLLLRWA